MLSNAAIKILRQLTDVIHQISPADLTRPSKTLGGSTVGQHIRHTLEFFSCFNEGYECGLINYDRRNRNRQIECDKTTALAVAEKMMTFAKELRTKKDLRIEIGYDPGTDECVTVDTNSDRELIYNIEHAVHHMAIMKIGLKEVAPYVKLEDTFGVAASTIRHGRHVNSIAE
jgi:hypothetical protein